MFRRGSFSESDALATSNSERQFQSRDFKPDPARLLANTKPPSWLFNFPVEVKSNASWTMSFPWNVCDESSPVDVLKRSRVPAFVDLQSDVDGMVSGTPFFVKLKLQLEY